MQLSKQKCDYTLLCFDFCHSLHKTYMCSYDSVACSLQKKYLVRPNNLSIIATCVLEGMHFALAVEIILLQTIAVHTCIILMLAFICSYVNLLLLTTHQIL